MDAAPDPRDVDRAATQNLSPKNILIRTVSAFVLMPAAIGASILGGTVFAIVVAALCTAMLFEWTRMAEGAPFSTSFGVLAGFSLAALFFAAQGGFLAALALALGGGAAASAMAAVGGRSALWPAVGAIYLSLACVAFVWLRGDGRDGLGVVLFLFLVIWATDTGAFLFGRAIGGPKLFPRVSPNKTWAGLFGGALCAAAISAVFGAFWRFEMNIALLAAAGASLAAVSQAGDIFESALKRHFGVKDASGLIPGHGGVLDRLDGMIFAVQASALAMLVYDAAK